MSDRVQARSGLFAFLVLTGAYVTKSTGKLFRVLDIFSIFNIEVIGLASISIEQTNS